MPSLEIPPLRAAYLSGRLTPTALIDELLDRIDASADPAVWIHRLSRDELHAHARRVEARGPAGLPLYGVPFAIKDNIDLAGAPTTAACPDFAYTPTASAAVVQRLMDAGAIPLGKTNLDQFATGLVGVRSPYGVPRNPFHAGVIPGGSSSGSAVAVAAGLVSFALGTDTAGSGRVPAGLNNIVGLKPTRGALSTRGVVPACRTLDCVSVFALTCDDAALIGGIAEAFDREDPFSRARPDAPARTRPAVAPAAGARPRIGVPPAAQLEFFGDAEAARLFHGSLERLVQLGFERVEIDFSGFRAAAALLYQGPWIAERWAALRTFHAAHADGFLPVTRSIIEGARSLTAADTFEGIYQLAELAAQTAAEWEKMDVLLVPTAPRPYTLAEVEAEPIVRNTQLGTYTNFVNLLDLAALAVPAGLRSDGVPWGVTAIAPAWQEGRLLEFGRAWESESPPPGRVPAGTEPEGQPTRRSATGKRSPDALRPGFCSALSVAPPPAPVRLAVVGAHLSGLPLNHQLTDLGARLSWSGKTAPDYRLYALPGTVPPKPGLQRVNANGTAVVVEVWELPAAAFGAFVAQIPPPLCIGTVRLENGDAVKGFLCEAAAVETADDISQFGGWRAYLAAP